MSSSTDERAAPVSSPRLRLLARVIVGLTILGIAAGIWFSIIDAGKVETDLAFLFSFCLFPIIGYILVIRRPDNAISWLMLGIGACFGLDAFVGSYASYAIHGGVGGFHAGAIALAFDPMGICRRRAGGGSPGSWASAWRSPSWRSCSAREGSGRARSRTW
jgi:hypothetical protein